MLTWIGLPLAATLVWVAALIRWGRVPLRVLAGSFALCLGAAAVGVVALRAGGEDPTFGRGVGWNSGTAADLGILLSLNGFAGATWCAVLTVVALPVNVWRERTASQARFMKSI